MARTTLLLLLFAVSVPATARAEVGFRLGSRAGVELHDDADLSFGADMRLSFALSPLTINPAFDYYVDEDKTLFQVAVNALYHLPAAAPHVDGYGGVGVGVTAFSFHQGVQTNDDHGSRLGLNLLAGVCFDLPVVAPYAQVVGSVGELDLFTISAGLLVELGGGERWDSCGRRTAVQP